MTEHDQLVARIAFASYRGINLGTAKKLADKGVGCSEFFEFSPSALSSITSLRPDTFSEQRRREALTKAAAEAEFVVNNHIKTLFYTDGVFPARLLECDDAPVLLYGLGDGDLNLRHIVSIVGTRHSTAYGIEFTSRLVRDLAERLDSLMIISGLAYGIDIAAHKAALAEGIPTCAVFAHGLNTVYPADHRDEARRIIRDRGALLTEYRSCDAIHRGNFLARNRIVAGLADVTVVVESDRHGGAMSTAAIAGAYNRDVMAVPGRTFDTYSRGCNDLIARQGAQLLRDADDLIEALGWKSECKAEGKQKEMDFILPAEQEALVKFIREHPEATVNDICVATGMSYSHLSSLLFDLEMNDVLIALPGGRYTIISG